MATIGLDIGASTIKAVLVEDGERPRLLAGSIVDQPAATWPTDLVGQAAVATSSALKGAIKKAIGALGWTRQYRLRVSIADSLIVTQIRREREVPQDMRIARIALGESVRKELNLSPVWRAADCIVIERPGRGISRPCRVAVALADATLVDAIHAVVGELGYRMSHLDINTWGIGSFADKRLAFGPVDGLHGVINMGHSFVAFALFHGDTLEEYALTEGGGGECCEMLAGVVGPGRPRDVLTRRPLIPLGADKDDMAVFEAFGAIAPTIQKAATLVRDRLEAHALFSGTQQLQRLYVAGGLSSLKNLPELFAQEFGVPVEPMPLAQWLAQVPQSCAPDLPVLAPAIGMALRAA